MLKIVTSCEHGGNIIPPEYSKLFKEGKEVLNTHRGLDIGILPLAKVVSDFISATLHYSEISRLLVELNRSLDNPDLFSSFTQFLPDTEKQAILEKFYFPYRRGVEKEIKDSIKLGDKVIHISFHSFTPILNGVERIADIGLLFDPSREREASFCTLWKKSLENLESDLRVLYNSPYLGVEDGFTTYLRNLYRNADYAGIELEVNQKYLINKSGIEEVSNLIKFSLQAAIDQFNS